MQMQKSIISTDAKSISTTFPLILNTINEKGDEQQKKLYKDDSYSSEQQMHPSQKMLIVPRWQKQKKATEHEQIKKFMRKADILNNTNLKKLKQDKPLPQFPKNDRSATSLYKFQRLDFQNEELYHKQKEIKKIYLPTKKMKTRNFMYVSKKRKISLSKEVQTETQTMPYLNANLEMLQEYSYKSRKQLSSLDVQKKQRQRYIPSLQQIKEDSYQDALPKRERKMNNISANKSILSSSAAFNPSSTNANSFLESMSKISYDFSKNVNKLSKGIKYKEYQEQETIYSKTIDVKPIVNEKQIIFPNLFTIQNEEATTPTPTKLNPIELDKISLRSDKDKSDRNQLKSQKTQKNDKTEQKSEKQTNYLSLKDSRNKFDLMSIIAEKTESNSIVHNMAQTQNISFSSQKKQQQISDKDQIINRQYLQTKQQTRKQQKEKCQFLVQVPSYHQLKINEQSSNLQNSKGLKNHPIRVSFEEKDISWITQKYRPQSEILKQIDPKTFQIKKYKNGVFFGELNESNQKHGKGVIFYYNGRIYEGQFQNDIKNGKGHQVYPDGSNYKGDFKNGIKEGKGVFEWPNGQLYDGQWQAGKKNGSGMWKGSNGDSYIGEWNHGKVDGFGVFLMKNGSRYEGQFKNSLKHGVGTQRFQNGQTYVGAYEKNRPNGEGEYYWANGDYYKGEFSNGLRHGNGYFKDNLGSEYKGQYRNDKKCGQGELFYQNGINYTGNFENNLRHGYGKLYQNDLLKYEGYWINDKEVQNMSISPILQDQLERQQSLPANVKKGNAKITKNLFQMGATQSKSKNKSPNKNASIQSRDKSPTDNFKRACGCNKKH